MKLLPFVIIVLLGISYPIYVHPQEIQFITWSFVIASLVSIRMLKDLSWNTNQIMLLFIPAHAWWLVRIPWSKENAIHESMSVIATYSVLLATGFQWKSRLLIYRIFIWFMAIWNTILLVDFQPLSHILDVWGPFSQENHFHFINFLSIGLCLYQIIINEFHKKEAILLIPGLLELLVHSSAKNNWLAIFGSLFSFMLLSLFKPQLKSFGTWKWFIVISAWIVTFGVVFPLIGSEYVAQYTNHISITSRIDILKASMNALLENPILGLGSGQFGHEIRMYWPNYWEQLFPTISKYPEGAHNLWINILITQGLVGFILLIAPIVYMLSSSMRIIAARLQLEDRIVIAFLIGLFVISVFTESGMSTLSGRVLMLMVVLNIYIRYSELKKITTQSIRIPVSLVIITSFVICAISIYPELTTRYNTYDIVLHGRISNSNELKKMQASLESKPISPIVFGAYAYFLNAGFIDESQNALNELEKLSGTRYDLNAMRLEIAIKKGSCQEALEYVYIILRVNIPEKNPLTIVTLRECLWKSHND